MIEGMHSDSRPRSARLVGAVWSSSVVRYLTAGGLAFAFDFGFLWLLHEVFLVPLVIATPTAFLASFVVSYSLQRTVAFRAESAVAPSVVKYALLVAANTVLTTGIVWGADRLGLPWEAGKVLAVIATTIGNYFAYRYWVFAHPERQSEDV